MSKLKTRKAVAKRAAITKKGKIKKSNAFRGHLLTSKNRKRKRHLKKRGILTGVNARKTRAMMPYGSR
jgi:large subunit ribosomal protein L35